jgi:polyisoprenoid-binding protein YceI
MGVLNASVESSSLKTGNKQRDRKLQSKAFFAADRCPSIELDAPRVRLTASGFAVTGNLMIKDSLIPIDVTVSVHPETDERIVLRAHTTISRAQADLAWNFLGMIRGDADVQIELVLARVS